MAGKKNQKKTGKRTARRTGLKRANKGLYKAVKAIAKNEAEKQIETKYISFSTNTNSFQPQVKNTLIPKLDTSSGDYRYLQRVIPLLFRGQSTDGFIGSRIHLVSGKTDFLIRLNYDNQQSTSIIVKVFCLESRSCKSYDAMDNALVANTLLRNGNDTCKDWGPNTGGIPELLDMLPVNKSNWKVQAVKSFYLSKNTGFLNNSSAAICTNAPGKSYHKFTWHWGKDMVLKYNDNNVHQGNTGAYPENYAPVFGVVAWCPDGAGNTAEDNQYMPVYCMTKSHMYYKDG